MRSRGVWTFMGARTRRSLTLTWTALFVLSLLLQYASFAAAPAVLAVHDEGCSSSTATRSNDARFARPDDWATAHRARRASADAFIRIGPRASGHDDLHDRRLEGRTEHDRLEVEERQRPPDKDDIEHALCRATNTAARRSSTSAWTASPTTATRTSASGSSRTASPRPLPAASHRPIPSATCSSQPTSRTAARRPHDPPLRVGRHRRRHMAPSTSSRPARSVRVPPVTTRPVRVANSDRRSTPPGRTRPSRTREHLSRPNSFFEGGIDLDQLFGGQAPCFTSFLAETRSSQAVDSTLS